MSAGLGSLGVPQVNPMGQGFNGMDPNFTVPRQTAGGDWQRLAINDPATKGFNTSDNPASFIDQLILREDFPPGPEGDAAYASALQNYLNTPAQVTTGFDDQGNPVRQTVPGGVLPNNRTGTQQNVFDAQQAAAATSQGGSSSLATINWAANHPEEALSALMAINPNTGEGGFLDDATIRDIVTGLGGIAAVNQMIAAERQSLIASGAIPQQADPNGVPAAPGQPNQGSQIPVSGSGAGIPPGTPLPPGDAFSVPPGSATGPPVTPIVTGQPPNVVHTNKPGNEPGGIPGLNEPLPIEQAPQNVQDAYARPYQMQQNGEIVGTQELPGGYQYTQVGNDVYLDVTDPYSGMTHRFTGDVVEAAYTLAGVSSFDELVAKVGYADAVQMLFGFIAPPQPPAAAPAPPPTAYNSGGPGSAGPVNPGSPAPPSNYFPEPSGPPTNQPTYY